jgi:hypothetical protein
MEGVEFRCKACGSQIKFSPMILFKGAAECKNCGSLYPLSSLQELAQQQPPPDQQTRERVTLPKGISTSSGDGYAIHRKWFSGTTIFFLIFGILWNGFVITWNTIAILGGDYTALLFSSVHTLVGIFIAYKVIADFLNTTTITVRFGELQLKHGPVPWPGSKTIPAGTIDQLYCKKHVSRSSKGGSSTSYTIQWVDREGKSRTLLGGFTKPEQALFIEQEVESYLGIQDRYVQGSYR